jgi:adenosylhomocysteinase
VHLGTRAETDAHPCGQPGSGEEICLFNAIKAKLAARPDLVRRLKNIIGVTEETTTGVRPERNVGQARWRSAPSANS